MKISVYQYRLWFKGEYATVSQRPFREGALLRMLFKDGCIGYSDCHPWVELGDLPLQDQLAALSKGRTTPLLACSEKFARVDAEARAKKQSVFDGLEIPKSHLLLSLDDSIGKMVSDGFDTFKVKCGSNSDRELETLRHWNSIVPTGLFRLDFNEKLCRNGFVEFWRKMPGKLQKQIDFIEDPYPYDPTAWTADQEYLQVSFASDRQSQKAVQYPNSCHAIVLKPAVERMPNLLPVSNRFVVTTYLDHPVGQMCAAYASAILKKQYPHLVGTCGLMSHLCYERNEFIDAMRSKDTALLPTEGNGFGFDSLLEALPWQNL